MQLDAYKQERTRVLLLPSFLRLMHVRDRVRMATSTASQITGLCRISSQTVINRLRHAGLQESKPVRLNALTAHHLAERRRWCQEHIQWRRAPRRTVLFSDQSRFMLFRADGRSRIYRRHNERYATKYVLEHDRFGSDSVMVWAGIHHDGSSVSVDVNGASRSTGIRLQHHIVPLIKVTGGVWCAAVTTARGGQRRY